MALRVRAEGQGSCRGSEHCILVFTGGRESLAATFLICVSILFFFFENMKNKKDSSSPSLTILPTSLKKELKSRPHVGESSYQKLIRITWGLFAPENKRSTFDDI